MSQENNQKVVKFDLVKEIRTEYNQEILDWLKERDYNYKIHEIKDLRAYQSKEDIKETVSFAEIEPVLFHKLNKIADFIGDNVHNFIEMLLSKTIEEFEVDPYHPLSFWLEEKELIKKIFKSGDKLKNLKADDDTPEENNKEETITISIPRELYDTINELCKINNLDTNDKINNILGDAVYSAEIDEEDGSKHVFNF